MARQRSVIDLDISGQSVLSQLIEFTVILRFSGNCHVLIASPLTLTSPSGTRRIVPDRDPAESFEPVRKLVGQTVTESVVEDSGTLRLGFDGGASIRVEPDPHYEAWTVSGTNGRLIVSMPGGELAVWNAEEQQTEQS